jgi:hypothetical protein
MKNILKLTAFMLILAGSFYSCDKKNNPDDTSWIIDGKTKNSLADTANIIGKWKLVKVTTPFVGSVSNYSNNNIVYEFKTNNVLTISGKTSGIDLYRGHDVGEYFYSIIKNDNDYSLQIATLTYGYSISSKELKISLAHLDGSIYNLTKINQ